ncbi:hypothetical protein ACHWQZ_G002723 [Mnemiopsis leidyi]
MTYDYSNFDQFGIKDDTERYLYATWLMFVVTCSLFGDTIILVASLRYNAFYLHHSVVVFIQHIAICDLLNATGNIFPAFTSLLSNTGGSNSVLKYFRFFINYWVFTASPALTSFMTLSKLLLLRYPLRVSTWTKRQAHLLCVTLWTLSLSVPLLHLTVDTADVIFDFRSYTYNYKYSSTIWRISMPVTALLAHLAPNICIITSTVLLLLDARKVARKSHESLRWQGTMTVVLTASVYTLSFLPITVYFIVEPFVGRDPQVPGMFYKEFYRLSEAVLTINVLSNFFIYGLTVRSFRNFLKSKLLPSSALKQNFNTGVCTGKLCNSVQINKNAIESN